MNRLLIKNINIINEGIKTSGDIFHDKKISDIGGKNIFCKEIEKQLSEKKIEVSSDTISDNFRKKVLDIVIYSSYILILWRVPYGDLTRNQGG